MTSYEIRTPIISVNQMYRAYNGRYLMSKKGREVKDAISLEILSQRRSEPLRSNVAVNILFYFPDKRKRDIDNHLKALLDCCTGLLYLDDSQIVELHVYKNIDKKNPRTVIQIL